MIGRRTYGEVTNYLMFGIFRGTFEKLISEENGEPKPSGLAHSLVCLAAAPTTQVLQAQPKKLHPYTYVRHSRRLPLSLFASDWRFLSTYKD